MIENTGSGRHCISCSAGVRSVVPAQALFCVVCYSIICLSPYCVSDCDFSLLFDIVPFCLLHFPKFLLPPFFCTTKMMPILRWLWFPPLSHSHTSSHFLYLYPLLCLAVITCLFPLRHLAPSPLPPPPPHFIGICPSLLVPLSCLLRSV